LEAYIVSLNFSGWSAAGVTLDVSCQTSNILGEDNMASKLKARASRVWAKPDGFRLRLNGTYYTIPKSHSQYDTLVATALTAISMNASIQIYFDNNKRISSLAIMDLPS
jgi:hypothetical protein